MKILVIGAGFDRSEKALLKGLVSAGIEIEVIYDPEAPDYALLESSDVVSEGMRFSSRLDFKSLKILRRKIEKGEYDIIHSLTNRALSNSLIATRGRRVAHIAYRGTLGHLSRFDPASWMTYLNPRVDRIVCVSDAVREYLKTMGLPDSLLVTIYKGHDVGWYTGESPGIPLELNVPADAFVVGFAGGLRPVKGLEYLIESASLLPEGANIHYLLLGEGALDVKLKRMVREKGVERVVHFAGFRDDAASIIGACDVFVMPSVEREGLPRGVIEAMAQGLPAIVTNVGGMPELVRDSECGIVIEPRNAAAIADAVKILVGDRTKVLEYGQAAAKRIAVNFNINDTIKKTIDLYREVLSSE